MSDAETMGGSEAEETAAAPVQLCSFRVGAEHYVVHLMRIREIVNPQPITPVRRGSPLIEGVIDLRGQIIPIVDLRRLLGLEADGSGRSVKHVIVTVGGRLVGLVVDAMGRVIPTTREAIKRAPPLMGTKGGGFFPGVIEHGGRLHFLLDLKGLLEGDAPTPGDLARLRAAARDEGSTP